MELAQITHLTSEAPPFAYDQAKAGRLRFHLTKILARIEAVACQLKTKGS
jgi:formiminoglutamase